MLYWTKLRKGVRNLNSINVLNSAITALIMSFVMSLTMCLINIGFYHPHFALIWLRGWFIAFFIALPLSYFLPPQISKLTKKFLKK